MSNVIKLKNDSTEYSLKYSVCTIVNDADEYKLMRDSFVDKGFRENCEYIIADNTEKNEFDAYQAISHFFKIAKGEFLIIVHQDVRLIDDIKKLDYCLNDLEKKDKNWGVCGNAGARGYHQTILNIAHKTHTEITLNLPQQVKVLDENLLIIKASSNVTISSDLKGFHLYGTDICMIAKYLGYSSYVIDFLVLHLSKGNIKSLKKYETDFINTYGKKLDIGYTQTNCTQFYLSNSPFKNRLYNSKIIFFIVKQFQRYPYLLKKQKVPRKIIKNE